MYSISTSLQSQILLPFSYVVSQYPGIRSSRSRLANPGRNKNLNDLRIKSEASAANLIFGDEINSICTDVLKDLKINEITPSALRNFALTGNMLKNVFSLNHIRYFSHFQGWRPSWHQSHTSFNSFTENKNGHPFSWSLENAILTRVIDGSRLSNVITSLCASGSTRNFKTQQSIERKRLQQPISLNRFKTIKKSEEESRQVEHTETNKIIKNLLKDAESEETQNKIKLAFAEGYSSASTEPKKEKSKFLKILDSLQSLTIFLLIITVLVIIWSSMGGVSFRMQLRNGNQVNPEEITVTFEDVKGVEEAKMELQEIVEFLKNPDKFTSLGAELPKGALLVGPPGTGKTLLARAVAGEAGVPFFHTAGPEFDEILVGQGARRVRDLFHTAKVNAPCVIFIDEIDSVGAKRSNSMLHPYANQTINQLLSEMDGFHKNEGVIVLGATNRRDDLDKALLRPGRFDVEVQVPIPDLNGRKEIFSYYLGKVKLGPDVDLNVLARGTTGFTGADIKNVVNQAALRAAADHLDAVSMMYLEEARDKVLMGPERKSRIPDEEANLLTAYHESGHTVVAYFTKDSHPLHKVTIIPRGPSLGHTAYIPAKEQYHLTRSQMMAMMDSLMGGRAAEEIIFGAEMITTGASSDLKQATGIASQMVKDFGMSERVGLRTFENNASIFKQGDSIGQNTKEAIDGEIKRILQESYERAKTILKGHAKEHKALAEALMKYETLDANDIKSILEGKPLGKAL